MLEVLYKLRSDLLAGFGPCLWDVIFIPTYQLFLGFHFGSQTIIHPCKSGIVDTYETYTKSKKYYIKKQSYYRGERLLS